MKDDIVLWFQSLAIVALWLLSVIATLSGIMGALALLIWTHNTYGFITAFGVLSVLLTLGAVTVVWYELRKLG